MTDEERAYLLARCLRLEIRIAQLEGHNVAPPLEQIARRSLDAGPLPSRKLSMAWPHRPQRYATANDIAQMRDLRRRGLCFNEIARRTHFSEQTARRYTKDMLIEQERQEHTHA